MNAKVPNDLKNPIRKLEKQAYELIANENFDIAKSIYKSIYEILFERQYVENRRIHLGAPLHMMGLVSLFQRKNSEAFRYFLLAYVTDTINTARGNEDKADSAPAYNAIKTFFDVDNTTTKKIKEKTRQISNRQEPFDVEKFLTQFKGTTQIMNGDLLSLSNRQPTDKEIDNILEQIFQKFFVTESGRILLNEKINVYSSKILKKAFKIAQKNGHPNEIRKGDIDRAISEMETEKGEN